MVGRRRRGSMTVLCRCAAGAGHSGCLGLTAWQQCRGERGALDAGEVPMSATHAGARSGEEGQASLIHSDSRAWIPQKGMLTTRATVATIIAPAERFSAPRSRRVGADRLPLRDTLRLPLPAA